MGLRWTSDGSRRRQGGTRAGRRTTSGDRCFVRWSNSRAGPPTGVMRFEPGGLARRELLAVKPRQGAGNIYEHTCARLNRNLHDRQPGLNAFGDRMPSLKQNQAQRQAELDANRAVAHAFPGQVPLATSRPLAASRFGGRRTGSSARVRDGHEL